MSRHVRAASLNLLLVTGFLRRYLVLHRELIDDVERELAPVVEFATVSGAETGVTLPHLPQRLPLRMDTVRVRSAARL